MIDTKEHIYHDDPKLGHPDVRTFLKDVDYFFLGNGLIQLAIQQAPAGEGSPYGLIFMNPDRLVKKREALSFHPQAGFSQTMLQLWVGETKSTLQPQEYTVAWCYTRPIPTVAVGWSAHGVKVEEFFYCPEPKRPMLIREIHLENKNSQDFVGTLKTALIDQILEKQISLAPKQTRQYFIHYILDAESNTVKFHWLSEPVLAKPMADYLHKVSSLNFNSELLDHFFRSACFQLPAVISKSGVVDAGIWQYNREWVRDHSFMALGLTQAGHHDLARTLLQRLVRDFVSNEGDCIDSSEKRAPEDVELDQNGTLLYALKNYALWTGDLDLIAETWHKIVQVADFPFQSVFRHQASGLFHNSREYWERHQAHGITDGIELMYQVFPAIGLAAAAMLARMLSKNELARHWDERARALTNAILHHPDFALVDEHGFIKRRNIMGPVQESIAPPNIENLPAGIPLRAPGRHLLQPDSSTAMPIVYGFISPDSPIAGATLAQLELLWNQGWKIGGHGRYNYTSEADSPGPWPFTSLYIARAYAETGDSAQVWRILEWLKAIPGGKSGTWFEMYGDRLAPPYPQIGITPWNWAEMIMLFIQQLIGIQPEEHFLRIRPKFLPGLEKITGTIPFRNHQIHLDLVPGSDKTLKLKANVPILAVKEQEIHLPYGDDDIFLVGQVPRF